MHDHDLEFSPGNSLTYDFIKFCDTSNIILCIEGGYTNYDYEECVSWFCRKYSKSTIFPDIMFLIQGFLVLPLGFNRLKKRKGNYTKDFYKFHDKVTIYSFDTPRSDPKAADNHFTLCEHMDGSKFFSDKMLNKYTLQIENLMGLEREEPYGLSSKYSRMYCRDLLSTPEKIKIRQNRKIFPQLKNAKSPYPLELSPSYDPSDYESTIFEHSRYYANQKIAQRLLMLYKTYKSIKYRIKIGAKLVVLCGAAHEAEQDNSSLKIPEKIRENRLTISKHLEKNNLRVGVVNCIANNSFGTLGNSSSYLLNQQGKKYFKYPAK
ncbi:MAG: hypothetical protein GY750_18410 [Lentisphaerae bacterium]|nr:hypothetical protein [Lentisphaerota bacterium]MCP4103371.1 hypothetical protein [Lentisphaerota bacterium]